MKKVAQSAWALLMIWSLCACTGKEMPVYDKEVFAMDTVMMFTAYGGNGEVVLKEAEKEIYRLDALLSRTKENSAVGKMNASSGERVAVDSEVCSLLQDAAAYTEATEGTFDITIAPVVSAWGFTTDGYQVPSQAELDTLLQTVGMEHVEIEQNSVRLHSGTQIDLGGIAKGYASDRVAEVYRANDVAHGTVALGGNVLVLGNKADGTPWRVGVRDPRSSGDPNAYAAVLNLTDAFAVTSGGYERQFEENGRTYHHILDPATGYPADSGLLSVTVVAECGQKIQGNGTLCDALSTALFVMGEERAVTFWKQSGYSFDMVLVTEDGRVITTVGLAEALEQIEGSGYRYETIA